jgi:UDP-N-acetylglucosamine:LPS N-acetylglucosamine transferase
LVQGIEDVTDHGDNNQLKENKKPTIMVNCGSLGSASVHEAVLHIMSTNMKLCAHFDRIVLLGRMNVSFRSQYEQYPHVQLHEFVDQITL